jgi:hypothetical protein
MPYVVGSRGFGGVGGWLGCGGDCPCRSCRSKSAGLSEWYEADKMDGLGQAPPVRGRPARAPAAPAAVTVTAPHPTQAGVQCTATERRIRLTRPTEAPASSLVTVEPAHRANARSAVRVDRTAYDAYKRMKQAAEADGIPAAVLTIVSGFRSLAEQRAIWQQALQKYGGEDAARKWVARPGFSPHHTGRAFDLNVGGGGISSGGAAAGRNTPAYRWMVCNAARFGFTPYAPEPWHWEYNPPPSAPSGVSGWYGEPATPPLTSSEEKAFKITSHFEGGTGAVAGNFDGMGMSLGALQWNIGTGSLQPMLSQFIAAQPAAFSQIMGDGAERIRQVLAQPRPAQVQFFDGISVPPGKARLAEPWHSRFRALALHPAFVALQMNGARSRLQAAYRSMRTFGLNTERALAFMFDTVTQNGNGWLDKAVGRPARPRREIVAERMQAQQAQAGRPLTIAEKLEVIARVLSETSAARWRQNVLCRRMLIVLGKLPANMTCPNRYRNEDLTTRFQLGDQVIPVPGTPAGAGAAAAAQAAGAGR